jgi:hypothetical protein
VFWFLRIRKRYGQLQYQYPTILYASRRNSLIRERSKTNGSIRWRSLLDRQSLSCIVMSMLWCCCAFADDELELGVVLAKGQHAVTRESEAAPLWMGGSPLNFSTRRHLTSQRHHVQHHPVLPNQLTFVMPIRPFPIPYRTGIDICRVSRIRTLLLKEDKLAPIQRAFKCKDEEHNINQRFLARFLTQEEIDYFWERRVHRLSSINDAVEHLAGR